MRSSVESLKVVNSINSDGAKEERPKEEQFVYEDLPSEGNNLLDGAPPDSARSQIFIRMDSEVDEALLNEMSENSPLMVAYRNLEKAK